MTICQIYSAGKALADNKLNMSKVRNIKVILLFGILISTILTQTTPAGSTTSPYPSDSAVAGIGQDLPIALGGSTSVGGGDNPAASTSGGDLAYDTEALEKLSK